MVRTKKIVVYFGMVFVAAVIAGIYGIIHDQISYTFSPEYFTKFKFIQFNLIWLETTPRLGAAVVGFLATWWMGVLVCLLLGLVGFIFETPKLMASHLSRAFVVVTVVALLTGLVGLAVGYLRVTEATIDGYMQWLRPEVTDPIQFVRVGFMHNASYLGGLTGLIAGITYLIRAKRRL
ncbi:MAG: signal peptide-containing protein [Anaerolineae bacterium]